MLRVAGPARLIPAHGAFASEALPADALAIHAGQGGSIPTPTLFFLRTLAAFPRYRPRSQRYGGLDSARGLHGLDLTALAARRRSGATACRGEAVLRLLLGFRTSPQQART